MNHLEKYKQLIDSMTSDIRFEVLLAELITDQAGFEEVEVASNSVFLRNFHRDLERTEEFEYVHSRKKRLRFTINRDGFYDFLPEDLVHQPSNPGDATDYEKVVAELKVQEQREQAARKFFLPYEQEIYRLRTKLEVEERSFMFANTGRVDTEILEKLWDLPAFLDKQQKAQLSLLLPVLHRIIGNETLCSFLASRISNDEVVVEESLTPVPGFADAPELGLCQLGHQFVLGGLYSNTEPSVSWKILLPEKAKLNDYMPGGKKLMVHEYLANLMVPLENNVHMELLLKDPKGSFVLEEDESKARLGYLTYI